MYQYIPDPFVNWRPTRLLSRLQRFTRRLRAVQAELAQKRRNLRRRYRRWLNGGIDGDWVCPYPFIGWSCPKWLPVPLQLLSHRLFFVWMNREDDIWQEGRLRARGIEPAPVPARERFARLFHRPSFRR
ncbi:MAG TPA: hypothetical protein VKU60_20860 [Chloroflexota bacterium]|nr:hypothetical protein [Chloroflexota bacterium]